MLDRNPHGRGKHGSQNDLQFSPQNGVCRTQEIPNINALDGQNLPMANDWYEAKQRGDNEVKQGISKRIYCLDFL